MIILDKILEQAAIIKESFDTILKNNFSDHMLICASLKEKQAIINKARFRCFKTVDKIEDIVRATIIADTYEDALEIKAKIETLFDILHMNNFFETISPTGFRDINIKINFQDFTVEILILLKDIYLLEISETRKNYDKMKSLIERDDSEKFKNEILKIKEYNFKMFNKVIEDYNNKTLGIKLPLWDIKQIYN